jgi:hypothetical protein
MYSLFTGLLRPLKYTGHESPLTIMCKEKLIENNLVGLIILLNSRCSSMSQSIVDTDAKG